ncbi:MAG TPA: GNAT family N-acetyltransferase [Pyrinomonadaceae bacterium]|nr:GNAT family N-acetyltransferase [Pyrinomonadaceae bacterium]
MSITIRKPVESEVPEILRLMRDFAEFEGLSEYLTITGEGLSKVIFGEGSFVESLIAVDGDEVISFAIFYPHFSSFRGQGGYYLEDIYIDRAFRGKRVGESMLKEIAKLGKERGFERIDFQVLDWNVAAIDFYLGLGAICSDDDRHYKFTDDAFEDLAS